MTWKNEPHGQKLQFKRGEVFFGNALSNRIASPGLWQNSYRVHQVHGSLVIPAQEFLQKADGHFTSSPGHALGIQTADCMPVFISMDDFKKVYALHIGWRGLEKRILTKALAKENLKKSKVQIFVGPHIQQESFYLNHENGMALLKDHSLSFKEARAKGWVLPSYEKSNQYHVDLLAILKREAHAMGLSDFVVSPINTYQSPDHFSHRRHNGTRGRQLSYIKISPRKKE